MQRASHRPLPSICKGPVLLLFVKILQVLAHLDDLGKPLTHRQDLGMREINHWLSTAYPRPWWRGISCGIGPPLAAWEGLVGCGDGGIGRCVF